MRTFRAGNIVSGTFRPLASLKIVQLQLGRALGLITSRRTPSTHLRLEHLRQPGCPPNSNHVVMPDRRWRDRPATPRRRFRRNSLAVVMVMAALAILPALLYVFERTEAAATGYSILQLQRELARLQSEHARLHTTVSTLKSPQRIERIATTELGMVSPRQRQLAAITLTTAVTQTLEGPPITVTQRIGRWLGLGEAAAREPDR